MNTARSRSALGWVLLLLFGTVLVLMFLPILRGQNALEYLDELYNSISKGSAYYIPAMREEADSYKGSSITASLEMDSDKVAEQTAVLYQKAGAEASPSGTKLIIKGDLGSILDNCLEDSEVMYNNNAEKVREKYGYDGRQALYNWWYSFKALDKDLARQKLFKEAKAVALVKKKAIETSYNYYGVRPQKITDRLGIVIFSLAFYVIYTLWYGYAIMFILEGLGLRLDH
ncbi:MAG: hypothetical protein ACYTE3_03945 [Planctomycetota bacterium]|jgi:hypothetical protein